MKKKQTIKLLTEKGFEKLKKELLTLQQKRPAMVIRMETARQMGDLRENSEYHSAREEMVFLENRMDKIKDVLKNAKIVKNKNGKRTINLGSRVTVKNGGGNIVYEIVGEREANPMEKKISYSSPLGQALMGKKKGERVIVKTPRGKVDYEIISIK